MSEILKLADKLRAEGEKFSGFYSGLSDEKWKTEVYKEGTVWTIRNILAHLVTAERAFVKLFESIRQGGGGVAEDFVIDRYNAIQQAKTKDLTPHELIDQYRAVRADMVAWILTLEDADLAKSGRHPFLGHATLHEMIKMVYIHNQTHYRDLMKSVK
jgi:uncharacterized damage-inducible protein DinB